VWSCAAVAEVWEYNHYKIRKQNRKQGEEYEHGAGAVARGRRGAPCLTVAIVPEGIVLQLVLGIYVMLLGDLLLRSHPGRIVGRIVRRWIALMSGLASLDTSCRLSHGHKLTES